MATPHDREQRRHAKQRRRTQRQHTHQGQRRVTHYAVSSVGYDLIRDAMGVPRTGQKPTDTEIPALCRYLLDVTQAMQAQPMGESAAPGSPEEAEEQWRLLCWMTYEEVKARLLRLVSGQPTQDAEDERSRTPSAP